jgi:hypothetical protein
VPSGGNFGMGGLSPMREINLYALIDGQFVNVATGQTFTPKMSNSSKRN